jgi:hypothetical protein
MRSNNSSPERKDINKHLWNYHGKYAASGSTFDRLVEHDTLHAEGNEDGYAGSPLHRHAKGTGERVGEVILDEGEGTI